MNPLMPLAKSSLCSRQAALLVTNGHLTATKLYSPTSKKRAAFTLIELLVVVAVIAILAGITMAAMGGVQKKSARSRAQAEVAALAAAIDNYHLDNGIYPATGPGALYSALSPVGSGKVYFEPRPAMVRTNGDSFFYIDPWGADYQYSTNSGIRNVGSYDLWTTAGSTNTYDDIRN
jgi:general secretion pathway protein G